MSNLLAALVLLSSFAFALELAPKLLDMVQKQFGSDARQRLEKWQELSEISRNAPEDRQLRLVNGFFNSIPFISDIGHWGQEDYWATPVEFLATNGGDCEDFSIAKYLTLRSLGVPDDKLRIVYVKALELNQAHMILAYYPTPDADPLILDNLVDDIKPASERDDLQPVYSFNGEGLWLTKLRGKSRRIGEAKKLDRWVDLNKRLIDSLR
ncbi:transglutaminase-like cysteine peptidase [Marinobacteraceae bacterium S3BR75-40.1]